MKLDSILDRAKDLIDDYCRREFHSLADFSDLSNIGIGYTTVTDAELQIQAVANLNDFRIERYLEYDLIEVRQYDSLETLIAEELENLDFDDLTYVSDEQTAVVRTKYNL